MKTLIVALALAVSGRAAGSDEKLVENCIAAIRDGLSDPYSAQFYPGGVRHERHGTFVLVDVNAKSPAGTYLGSKTVRCRVTGSAATVVSWDFDVERARRDEEQEKAREKDRKEREKKRKVAVQRQTERDAERQVQREAELQAEREGAQHAAERRARRERERARHDEAVACLAARGEDGCWQQRRSYAEACAACLPQDPSGFPRRCWAEFDALARDPARAASRPLLCPE
jgi:hypothetical protein